MRRGRHTGQNIARATSPCARERDKSRAAGVGRLARAGAHGGPLLSANRDAEQTPARANTVLPAALHPLPQHFHTQKPHARTHKGRAALPYRCFVDVFAEVLNAAVARSDCAEGGGRRRRHEEGEGVKDGGGTRKRPCCAWRGLPGCARVRWCERICVMYATGVCVRGGVEPNRSFADPPSSIAHVEPR